MSPLLSTLVIRLAESGEEETVNTTLSWGIGALVLAILLGLLFLLLSFGRGREHT